MENATSSPVTITSPSRSDTSGSPNKKELKQSSPKPRKKQRQKEATSPTFKTNSSSDSFNLSTQPLSTSTEINRNINNTDNNENDQDTIKNTRDTSTLNQPKFRYTTFPLKGYTILPTRNITSSFVRSDISYVKGNKAGDDAICPNAEEEWHDTIIIHPGSRNLRIGLASEAYPITVPHVIARRMKYTNQPRTATRTTTSDIDAMQVDDEEQQNNNDDDDDEEKREQHDDAIREMRNELNWRMKNAKRRTIPNADNQVISFNTNAPKETIPDHNDPYRVDWIDLKDSAALQDVYVADKALKVPLDGDDDKSDYRLFYPWRNGTLNHMDYSSLYAVLGDLQTIWTSVIHSELDIEDHTFENFNAVLVVPDIFHRSYICELITMMLQHMKFRGVIVQQASGCATFGAGVSSACVVDIGAQTTTITCVDEGVPIVDSRMTINIGGDDITKTFTSFLQDNQFPYHDLNLARSYDWRLVEELKEKWCTMNEAEISVQVYDFFVRAPHQHTYKYQCKVYDEVFLAPLCLVYPAILNNHKDDMEDENSDLMYNGFTSNGVIDDIAEEPNKKTNVYRYYPIDVAIAQSIQSASGNSDDRLKRYFTNIIVVGGGGKISNFDRVLEDRLLSTVIARSSMVDNVEVLPAPRELDPQILVWKGASVLCKLDIAKDMWIGESEWLEAGSRLLRDRSMLL
ncbi:uncharacterized protein BX664DRAFT_253659 [Halteromyces radiatus]|uniref:uncharacterized protein n=1 Tax=Halteromyces radiatus TaxID=101107 RepID=UPI002220219E|nr:uncharacterized protein BX664DRAFT_253659 [Halteromyces radiatus]KAI8099459.1 hypothetical protein BX664DRAFT_253659 [Halteromyces radiatus]